MCFRGLGLGVLGFGVLCFGVLCFGVLEKHDLFSAFSLSDENFVLLWIQPRVVLARTLFQNSIFQDPGLESIKPKLMQVAPIFTRCRFAVC